MNKLKVFSGKCCLCDVGIPTMAKTTYGDPVELHTGDIVILWNGRYLGTDNEFWNASDSLTAIVANQYQSYSDGTIILKDKNPLPFAMGIKDCGFNDPEWRIQLVKKYTEVIPGEHWKAYGFSYDFSQLADDAFLKGSGE